MLSRLTRVLMKLTIHFFLLYSLIYSTLLFGSEETLSITDNDDNKEVYNLVVNVNDSSQSLISLYKDTFVNGQKIKRENLISNDLNTKEGMILEKREKYNVLNLKSENFDNDRGGKILIDYLYNGITGERKFIELELAKDKNSWKLFRGKVSVSRFHVKVNKIIVLGTVGIKSIMME